jgi:hypothetical protein
VLLGVLVAVNVTVGAAEDLQFAVNVVACDIVTVVDALLEFAGVFPLTFVHPLKTYHGSQVALILTCF